MKKFFILFLIVAICMSSIACSHETSNTNDTGHLTEPEGTFLEQVLPENIATTVSDIDDESTYKCNPMTDGLIIWKGFVAGEAVGGRKCLVFYNTNPANKNNVEVILYDQDHYSVIYSQTDFDSTIEYKHCYYVLDNNAKNKSEIYMLLANQEHLKYDDVKDLSNGHHESGVWVHRSAAKIDEYYWVDGTENLTRDKAACQSAVEALKIMTDENHKSSWENGNLKVFEWEYLEADEEETKNYIATYSSSDNVRGNKITTDMLVNDFLALKAEYYIKFAENVHAYSGHGKTHIYMIRDKTGQWHFRDVMTPIMDEDE